MKTKLTIEEATKPNDYFPSLFTNKDKTIIILADGNVNEKTFSGMIIHSSNVSTKSNVSLYSTGWTYTQFKRLQKGSSINIKITQE